MADSAERIAANQTSQLLEDVVALCMNASKGADVLVVEGLHTDAEHPFESQINVDVARSLKAEVVLVADASLPHAATEARLAASQFANEDCRVAGVVFNKALAGFDRASAQKKLSQTRIWGVVPENPILRAPRTLDVALHLDAETISAAFHQRENTKLSPPAFRYQLIQKARAEQKLEDVVVLGTMMLAVGDVDGLVSGAVHTTANTLLPALQLIKTAPGSSIVSSVFFMLMPDQVLAYGDCAINPAPTADELAEIARQSADSATAFGIAPKVAMISDSAERRVTLR
jgi:BioD-like phosphotransacetylase family protein